MKMAQDGADEKLLSTRNVHAALSGKVSELKSELAKIREMVAVNGG